MLRGRWGGWSQRGTFPERQGGLGGGKKKASQHPINENSPEKCVMVHRFRERAGFEINWVAGRVAILGGFKWWDGTSEKPEEPSGGLCG